MKNLNIISLNEFQFYSQINYISFKTFLESSHINLKLKCLDIWFPGKFFDKLINTSKFSN